MKPEEQVYVALQKHLDRLPMGFPATRSGAELRLLKHIFTPFEARIAACLSHRPEPLQTVYARARRWVASIEELAAVLERMQKKGGIESRIEHGVLHYCNAPLVVGMYEMQVERLTPEFLKDLDAYTADPKFGLEFLGTALPQMRTIPIDKSLPVQHAVSSFDAVTALLERAAAPFLVLECICRKKKAMEGTPCKVTDRKETCLAIGGTAEMALRSGIGREIDRAEAVAIITENQQQGLVLQPSNTQQAEFICSCCGCCCGMLSVHQKLPKPLDFWASNFHAVVDSEACNGCGICEKRCQVGAVRASVKGQPAAVDLNRCLGCGVCVPTCPKKAITLAQNPTQVKPPQTRQELHDTILAHKKGRLGKFKLTGKLLLDSIRAGRTQFLK